MADEADDVAELGIEGLNDAVEIGVGGFATVFRANQPKFRRTVAVKVLATLNLDDAARERFERECQAMGSLSDHPNIVTVHGAGFTDGDQSRPYLVMAYLPGGSLAERIAQNGPLAWQDATLYGVHLAGALETAHRSKVIHRDIKPANVLTSAFGDALLTDFGIARISGGHETRSGVITASMHHAPPEVIDGRRPTVAGDVYSLASTLFELMVGRPPFEQPGDDGMVPMIRRILTEPPPDIRPLEIPEAVCIALERALAKEPDQRQQSAEEFGRELQAARRAAGLEGGKLTVPSSLSGGSDHGVAFVAAPSQVLCQHCHAELAPGADVCASCANPVGATVPPTAAASVGQWGEPTLAAPAPAPVPAASASGSHTTKIAVGVIVVLAVCLGIVGALLLSGGDTEVAVGSPDTTTEPAADTPGTTNAPGDPPETATTTETTTTTIEQVVGYTAQVEQNFLNACEEGGATSRNLCRCVFEGIREEIPFERFIEIDADVRDGLVEISETEMLPIITSCSEQFPVTG